MDNKFMFEVAIQIVVVAALIAALKTTVSFLVTRVEKVEEKLDMLPTAYIPRQELERALDAIKDEMKSGLDGIRALTTQIHGILTSYMAGQAQQFRGSLQAAGEPDAYPTPFLVIIPPHPGMTAALHAAHTQEIAPMDNLTAAVTLATTAAPAKQPNGIRRFIDEVAALIRKDGPAALQLAKVAQPFVLALSPFGPEFSIAVNGIEQAAMLDQQIQQYSGAPLTGTQKFAIALSAGASSLQGILAQKGITEPAAVQAASSNFIQTVYDLHTGPAVPNPAAPATTTTA